MHCMALFPIECYWYSFLLEAETTPRPSCGQKVYVNEKFQWHHQESNLHTSSLYHSASNNCTTPCPDTHTHTAPTKPSGVNRLNLLPLQYIHFNFQPLFTTCAYPWDTWNYIVSKIQQTSVKTQNWWCASHLICSTLPLSHNIAPVYKTLHTNVYWNVWL